MLTDAMPDRNLTTAIVHKPQHLAQTHNQGATKTIQDVSRMRVMLIALAVEGTVLSMSVVQFVLSA